MEEVLIKEQSYEEIIGRGKIIKTQQVVYWTMNIFQSIKN